MNENIQERDYQIIIQALKYRLQNDHLNDQDKKELIAALNKIEGVYFWKFT